MSAPIGDALLAGPRAATAGRWPFWNRAGLAAIVYGGLVVARLNELVPVLAPIRPTLLAAIALLFLHWKHSPSFVWKRAFQNRQFRLILSYFGWGALTVPLALWPGGAFQVALQFPVAIVLVLALLLCEPTLSTLSSVSGWMVITLGLYALAIFAHGALVGGRLTSAGMYDPNDLATLLAAMCPIGIMAAARSKGLFRLAAAGAVAVFILVVAYTASRGGFIALLIGTFVLVLGLPMRRKLFLSVVVFGAGFALWTAGPSIFRERAASILEVENDYNVTTSTGRVEIWKRGMGYLWQRPITGVGIGNYGEAEGRYFSENQMLGKWFTAHNIYVQAFVEMGLVGGILFLFMLFRSLKQGFALWRKRRKGLPHLPEYMASIVAFASGAFFLSLAYAYPLFWFLAIAELAASAARVQGAVWQMQKRDFQ